ncbi:MAG: hypothetical protein NT031_20270 [Planctomycetota bacterium]|nr:hypothetical protein [Planctomycetota bacterium]
MSGRGGRTALYAGVSATLGAGVVYAVVMAGRMAEAAIAAARWR